MKSLKDMELFEEKALRAMEIWGKYHLQDTMQLLIAFYLVNSQFISLNSLGLEILIEDMVESIHAAKTEKEDDIQGKNKNVKYNTGILLFT